MLTRLKELAVQVQNGTYSADDKANIGAEMKALGKAIGDIYVNTKFNGIEVFGKQEMEATAGKSAAEVKAEITALGVNGNYIKHTGGKWQVSTDTFDKDDGPTYGLTFSEAATNPGLNGLSTDTLYIIDGGEIKTVDVSDGTGDEAFTFAAVPGSPDGALKANNGATGEAAKIFYGEDATQSVTIGVAVTTNLAALTAATAAATSGAAAEAVTVTLVENAITEVNTTRAGYGALQNQLEHAANNLSTTKENLQSAESRVRDVDMAEEMMEYTKNNILMQAAQAMLAQANAQPQGILQLLH
jgi:flagellin